MAGQLLKLELKGSDNEWSSQFGVLWAETMIFNCFMLEWSFFILVKCCHTSKVFPGCWPVNFFLVVWVFYCILLERNGSCFGGSWQPPKRSSVSANQSIFFISYSSGWPGKLFSSQVVQLLEKKNIKLIRLNIFK